MLKSGALRRFIGVPIFIVATIFHQLAHIVQNTAENQRIVIHHLMLIFNDDVCKGNCSAYCTLCMLNQP